MIKFLLKWLLAPLVIISAWESGNIGAAVVITGVIVFWWVGKKALKLVLWGGGAVLILYLLMHMARP